MEIPPGILAAEEHLPPDLGGLYWVKTFILDPNDKKPNRPVAVIAIYDETIDPAIMTAVRSTSDRRGQPHPAIHDRGLSKPGWFTRLVPVHRHLWTPNNAVPLDVVLDDETLAYVIKDLLP